jgi:hypothetical protein
LDEPGKVLAEAETLAQRSSSKYHDYGFVGPSWQMFFGVL